VGSSVERWWSDKLTALHDAVRSAVLDSRRASTGAVNAKGDEVKVFDLAANDAAVTFLKGLFVPLIIDSEEAEQLKIGSGTPRHRLILDPVDGSDNWASGLPLSALSCAVLPIGAPLHVNSVETAIVGPLDEETPFLARKHGGAWQGDRRLETSHVQSVEMAVVSCELSHWLPSPAVARLMASARGIRSYGCASRALTLVAAGAIDAHVDLRNRLTAESYLAAGRLVIEAGGFVVGLRGGTMPAAGGLTDRIGLVAAASRPLCLEIVERLRDGGT
jgi:myo-inositol-1(or 4)-monophosphatase